MDWKSALEALGGAMPETTENNNEIEKETTSAPTGKEKKREKLSIFMEKKGRGGKVATIITGFTGDDAEVDEIARTLKKRIGVGGSSRGGEILLQGDWRDKAAEVLRSLNFKI